MTIEMNAQLFDCCSFTPVAQLTTPASNVI